MKCFVCGFERTSGMFKIVKSFKTSVCQSTEFVCESCIKYETYELEEKKRKGKK